VKTLDQVQYNTLLSRSSGEVTDNHEATALCFLDQARTMLLDHLRAERVPEMGG